MTANTALARGRAAAEALMADKCVIRRVTRVSDPVTGVQTEQSIVQIYFGKCRVQARGQAQEATSQDAGEARRLLLHLELQLPMSVTEVQTEDEVTILLSALDPDLPNRRFLVRDLMHKTHATARRIGIEEITS